MNLDSPKQDNLNPLQPPKPNLLDWLLTPIFIGFFILVLSIFDPVQRIAIRISRRTHEKVIVLLNRCLVSCLKVVGTSVQVENGVELPKDKPLIVVSNHQSMFDIPILHCAFAEHYPRFISKIELSKWIPSVSYNLRYGGNAIIDRNNPRQSVLEIQKLAERMSEQRFASVIFPEGTRAKDGKLKKFRTAGLATLMQKVSDAVVVPVAIDGAWKLAFYKGLPVPKGVRIKVSIAEPITPNGESADSVAERAFEAVNGKLERMRAIQETRCPSWNAVVNQS